MPAEKYEAAAVEEVCRVRDALATGSTRASLRGKRWRRPHRGIRVPTALSDDIDARVRAAALLLPAEGAVTGWAAARLYGAPWLDGRNAPVDVVIPPHRVMSARHGIRVVRSALPRDEVVRIHGLPITNGMRTCFELLRVGSFPDAVVAADALTHAGMVDVAAALTYAAGKCGWRGVRQVRNALCAADSRSESPGESRLRASWLMAGLPRPLVNPDLVAGDGSLLGRVDLLDGDAGVVAEFDGAVHRDPQRHAADVRRQQRLEMHGLVVVRFTVLDLIGDPARLSGRLHEARSRGLARDRRRDRWSVVPYGQPWWCYEPPGM